MAKLERIEDLFIKAARNGDVKALEDLVKWAKISKDELTEVIRERHYAAFRLAAGEGHVEVLKWLKKQAPAEIDNMIQAKIYLAFREAADTANDRDDAGKRNEKILVAVIPYLAEQVAPARLGEMFRSLKHPGVGPASGISMLDLYCILAKNNCENVFKLLMTHAPDVLSNEYENTLREIVKTAHKNGHHSLFDYLKEQKPFSAFAKQYMSELSEPSAPKAGFFSPKTAAHGAAEQNPKHDRPAAHGPKRG